MQTKIVIFGAGPGGYAAAKKAAQSGADVTLIEDDNVGGTCLNWGCIPSKIMINTAELLQKIRKAAEFGIDVEGLIRVNIKRLMKRKNSILQGKHISIQEILKDHNIRFLKGKGYIKGKGLVGIRLSNGETQEVPWDKIILATGTRPSGLPNLEFDSHKIISSSDVLCMQEVPESILIVGGGVIGCELAFMLSAIGSKVTIIEALSRMLPLPSVDEDCSKVLQEEMKKQNIHFMVNKTVNQYADVNGKLRVTIGPSPFMKNAAEKEKILLSEDVDKILLCVGRAPNSKSIDGLDSIGVKLDEKGWVVTNDRMQTSAEGVYAIGDLLGPQKLMLAHVASTEGRVAAENSLGGNKVMDYNIVPSAIFTSPEVANVGLTETQAKDQGYDFRSDSIPFKTLGKALAIGEITGQAKIVSEIDTGKILGVHIIGPHATDLIAEGTLAMKMGATVQDLANTIHAHPTLTEIYLEDSFKALN